MSAIESRSGRRVGPVPDAQRWGRLAIWSHVTAMLAHDHGALSASAGYGPVLSRAVRAETCCS